MVMFFNIASCTLYIHLQNIMSICTCRFIVKSVFVDSYESGVVFSCKVFEILVRDMQT